MAALIKRLNELFGAGTTAQDQLVYVKEVSKGKLLEAPKLRQQAVDNTKEQFAASPDLKKNLEQAIINAMEAHNTMSAQALNNPLIQLGILDILLNHVGLYESLRGQQNAG
jgi:type I restriction enzyme R subunit